MIISYAVQGHTCRRTPYVIRPSACFFISCCHTEPRRHSRCFPPRVSQLNAHLLIHRVCVFNDFGNRFNMRIIPNSRVLGSDPPFRNNSSSFNHYKPWTTIGQVAQMDEMIRRQMSIVGAILTHGRNKQTIMESLTPQCQRLEQFR